MTPSGWSVRPLASLADYINGRAFKPEDWSHAGLPIIRIAQMTNPQAETNCYAGLDVDERHLIDNGDVLFSWSATLAVMKWNRGPAILNQHIFKVIEKPGIDKNFLVQLLRNSIDELAEHSHGSTMKHIKKGVLNQFQVPVPPLPEQKKIAAILDSVDDAIQATQAVIDQTRKVKAELIEKLLFSIGEEGWFEYHVGDLVTLESGVSVNGEDRPKQQGEFGVLKISAVTYGKFNPMEHKTIRPEELQRAKLNPRKNSILMSRANTAALVGASVFVDQDYSDLFLPDKLWQLSATDPASLSIRWLAYVLASNPIRARLSDLATGTSASMKNISKVKFLSLSISVPPREHQDHVVSILRGIDEAEDLNCQKLERLLTLKQGLMADLLTGRKRVEVSA